MQERSQETRERILKAAVKLFAEKGYEASGVAQICSRSKVSKGSFYHHFPSKLTLFLELLKDWLNGIDVQLARTLEAATSVPEGLVEGAESGPDWKRILIVDDDETINMLLKRYLNRLSPGLTVLQAFDGFEAGKLISESRPGVILLDINLPGIDGHKLCQRIKADPSLGGPIIIAITGLADEDVGELILGEGADAFLRKPLDFDKLWSSIEELTAARTGRETAG